MDNILNILCPCHLIINRAGVIEHVAPTMQKILQGETARLQHVLDLFSIKPRSGHLRGCSMFELDGQKFHLSLRRFLDLRWNGVVLRLQDRDKAIIPISFGMALKETAECFELTHADFGPSELAVDMLCLLEAQSAVRAASRAVTQRIEGAKKNAEIAALTDPLTGLGNRRSLIERLASFARQNISFGIIQLDLDHFKTVNDQLGHPVGDRVLVELSNILRQEIRAHDVAVRLGGDEFILLITGTNDPTELLGLAERLLARLKPPLTIQTHKVQLGLSMGGRIVEAAERWSMIDILQAVDQALYHSKRRGKGRFTFCS